MMQNLDFASNPDLFHKFFLPKVLKSSLNEKIQIAYEFAKWNDMFPAFMPQSSKSVSLAKNMRKIGNNAYVRRDNVAALKFYTKSVAVAPVDSVELAYAYSNRSQALYQLERFEYALLDINRALRSNCTEDLKKKLYDRKEKCKSELRESQLLDPSDFVNAFFTLGVKADCLQNAMDRIRQQFNPDTTELYFEDCLQPLPETNFENKTIPDASEKIKINVSSKNKIFIMATADIKPGEVLAVEKPYAASLRSQLIYSHCGFCFKRSLALIPCENCSSVMYCTFECRENALKQYHAIECEILSAKTTDFTFFKWTAFRTLMVATKQGRELSTMMNHPVYKSPLTRTFPQNPDKKFSSQDYANVHNYGIRPSSKKFSDFSSEFPMEYFTVVAQWIYYLRNTTFFGQPFEKDQIQNTPLSDAELYVATFLLRCLQNGYQEVLEGTDVNYWETEEFELDFSTVGFGMFPFMNLFTHSCDPHVRMYFIKNTIICRCIRPIKAGEEIFDCFGLSYDTQPRSVRHLLLQAVFDFECVCEPCRLNWPVYNDLSSKPKVKANAICEKKFKKYAAKFKKLKKDPRVCGHKSLNFLCKYLCVLQSRFVKPCREYIDCQQMLHLLISLESNFYSSLADDVITKL